MGLAWRRVEQSSLPTPGRLSTLYTLHAGEQEALHLCLEFAESLLLTDDTAARFAAKSVGITVHGTIGILVRAMRRQTRSKAEVLELLRSIPAKTSLHIRSLYWKN